MVEAAGAIFAFFLILVLGLDVLRLTYNALSSQFLVARVIRCVNIGGFHAPGNTPQQDGIAAQDYILGQSNLFGLGLNNEFDGVPGNDKVCIKGPNDLGTPCSGAVTDSAGGPRDFTVVELNFGVPIFFGGTSLTVNALAIGRNEPFNTAVAGPGC